MGKGGRADVDECGSTCAGCSAVDGKTEVGKGHYNRLGCRQAADQRAPDFFDAETRDFGPFEGPLESIREGQYHGEYRLSRTHSHEATGGIERCARHREKDNV